MQPLCPSLVLEDRACSILDALPFLGYFLSPCCQMWPTMTFSSVSAGVGVGVGVRKAETASSFYGQELGVACITSAHILLART